MTFEKFYLIDYRGVGGRIILEFRHVENGRRIDCSTGKAIEILQSGEIQMQTKFCTDNFVERYARHKHRNLRNIVPGDPINIYHIPVELSADERSYVTKFYKE